MYPSGKFLVFLLGCVVGEADVEVVGDSEDGEKEASMA